MKAHPQQEKDLILAQSEVDRTKKELDVAVIGINKSKAFYALAEMRYNIAQMKEIFCYAIIHKRNFIDDINKDLKECYGKLQLSSQSFHNGDYAYVETQRHHVHCTLSWYKDCQDDYDGDGED